LGDAGRPGRADDDLAAVLLLEAQRLFERVGVRLVHLEAGVAFANPRLAVVQARLPLARGHLFDADSYLHRSRTQRWRGTQEPRRPQGNLLLMAMSKTFRAVSALCAFMRGLRSSLESPEQERGVGAAEPEGVRQRVGDLHAAAL